MEKLDEAVIERLERRKALTIAVASLTAEERREVARDLASELADEHRQLRIIKSIRDLLDGLIGW